MKLGTAIAILPTRNWFIFRWFGSFTSSAATALVMRSVMSLNPRMNVFSLVCATSPPRVLAAMSLASPPFLLIRLIVRSVSMVVERAVASGSMRA